jgi:hypothetical protein
VIRHSPEQQLRLDCWHAFAAAPSVKKKKKKKKNFKNIIIIIITHSSHLYKEFFIESISCCLC